MNGHKDIIILLPAEMLKKGIIINMLPASSLAINSFMPLHRNLFLMRVSHGTNQEHSTLV